MVPHRVLKLLENLFRAARAPTGRHGENQALSRAWEAQVPLLLSCPPKSVPLPLPGQLLLSYPMARQGGRERDILRWDRGMAFAVLGFGRGAPKRTCIELLPEHRTGAARPLIKHGGSSSVAKHSPLANRRPPTARPRKLASSLRLNREITGATLVQHAALKLVFRPFQPAQKPAQ